MDSFWQAVAEHNWEQPEVRQEFRLYYNDEGTVLFYSMENLPGNFIIVDKQTYHECRTDLLVRDGKIIRQTHAASWKLVPADEGSCACHPQDVTLIVDINCANKQFWKVKTTHEAN